MILFVTMINFADIIVPKHVNGLYIIVLVYRCLANLISAKTAYYQIIHGALNRVVQKYLNKTVNH